MTKHTVEATQELLEAQKYNSLQSQSPDLPPTEHDFYFLKKKLRAERPTIKQQLKAWPSISRDETQHLVMSMDSGLQAVIECKRISSKY